MANNYNFSNIRILNIVCKCAQGHYAKNLLELCHRLCSMSGSRAVTIPIKGANAHQLKMVSSP